MDASSGRFADRAPDPPQWQVGQSVSQLADLLGLTADRVQIVDAIASTNTELMSRPIGPVPAQPCLLLAERQLAGRGRRGRQFFSAPEDSLTFSVALERDRRSTVVPLSGLPLALGVALAQRAAGFSNAIGLKWPNDLMRGGRKCAGMLVETRSSAAIERIVIGLGLNLRVSEEIAARLEQPVAGLFDDAPLPASRIALTAAFAGALLDGARRFLVDGFADTAARWAPFDVFAGREIRIIEDGQVLLTGFAEGLDAAGALRVRTADGVVSVAAGDVSARPASPHDAAFRASISGF